MNTPKFIKYSAFTLIEFFIVTVVVLILLTLVAEGATSMLNSAHQVKCLGQVRDMNFTIISYTQDTQNELPPYFYSPGAEYNYDFYESEVNSGWEIFKEESLICPSDNSPGLRTEIEDGIQKMNIQASYAFNAEIGKQQLKFRDIKKPSHFSLMFDGELYGSADLLNNPSDTNNQNEGNDDKDKKITICHIPPGNAKNKHNITISINAWEAHKAHGDTLGPCQHNNVSVPPQDNNGNTSPDWYLNNLKHRHGNGENIANISFADGHVEIIKK